MTTVEKPNLLAPVVNPNDVTTPILKANPLVPSVQRELPITQPKSILTGQQRMVEFLDNTPQAIQNPYQFGKEQMFGADLKHMQFERYYAHPSFSKLGFSIYKDNEKVYNENSSWMGDLGRAVPQWANLVSAGFKDALSFGAMSDTERAKEFERAMAIGSSTRGGASSFMINTFLNSGYTVGIIGEMIAEEVSLALLTVESGGTLSALTLPRMMTSIGRGFTKIGTGISAGKNILKGLTGLGDINKARKYFAAAGKSSLKFLNPLEQTADFIGNYKTIDKLRKVSTGVGSFYRDVRNLRLAYGESSLEAGFVQNNVADQLLQEHYAKFDGRAPTKEEANAMHETAVNAGYSTFAWNMPVIIYSNKIVFDNMFKTFNPMKKLSKELIEENVVGKIVTSTVKNKTSAELVERSFKNGVKGFFDPKGMGHRALTYTKANWSEGMQEIAQEAISGAQTERYKNSYYSGGALGGVFSYMGENMVKQMSPAGAEVFFSGFLMGGMVQPIQHVVSKVMDRTQAGGLSKYKQAKLDQKEAMLKKVNILNDFYADPAKFLAPDLENIAAQSDLQSKMNAAEEEGDQKTFQDLKDISQFKHVATAIEMNVLDSMLEQLEGFKSMSPEEFKNAFPGFDQNQNSFDKIEQMIERSKNIQNRFNHLKAKHPNKINPNQYKKDSDEYKAALMYKYAYDQAIRNAAFTQHSFDRGLERRNALMGEFVNDTDLKNIGLNDFNTLLSLASLSKEIDIVKSEISPFKEGTYDKQSKQYVAEKQAKLERLETFQEALNTFELAKADVSKENLSPDEEREAHKALDKANKDLYSNYHAYLTTLAKVSKDHVFDANIQSSYSKLLDYYTSNAESFELARTINTLIDPENFKTQINRLQSFGEHLVNNRKGYIENALNEFNKIKASEKMLNELYEKANAFFDPKELNDLKTKGIMPKTFYYAEGGENKMDEINVLSEDYLKVKAIVETYVDDVTEIPIKENYKENAFSLLYRSKAENDRRTLKQLAKQFGFDPTVKETKIPLVQVLDAIVKSEFSSKREKALALRLKNLAGVDETVTFSSSMTIPGQYTETGQTQIDPRYSAVNYKGSGISIEVNILHQEIQRRTSYALQNDPKFKADMQGIYDAANEFLHKDQTQLEAIDRQGFLSLENFTAMAMSNVSFQERLAQVPYAGQTKKSTWTEFVSIVQNMIKRLFGKNSTNTALNAVVDVVTTKLDARPEGPGSNTTGTMTQTSPITGEVTNVVNTQSTGIIEDTEVITSQNINDIIYEDDPIIIKLKNDLLAAFKAQNRSAAEANEGISNLLPDWENMEDLQLLDSPAFKTYISQSYSAVKKLISTFNEVTGRTVIPDVKPRSTVSPIITETMREALLGLGYTPNDIRTILPAQAHILIRDGVKKKEDAPINEGYNATTQEGKQQAFFNQLANAKDAYEVDVLIDLFLNEDSLFKGLGLSLDELDFIAETRKQELANKITFADINVGDEIIISVPTKDGGSYDVNLVVDKKTTVDILGHQAGNIETNYKINMNEINTRVKAHKNMKPSDVKVPEINADVTAIIKDDIHTALTELNTENALAVDMERIKNESQEALKKAFMKKPNDVC